MDTSVMGGILMGFGAALLLGNILMMVRNEARMDRLIEIDREMRRQSEIIDVQIAGEDEPDSNIWGK